MHHLQPVEAGHADIKDRDGIVFSLQKMIGRPSIIDAIHGKSVLYQRFFQPVSQLTIIFRQ